MKKIHRSLIICLAVLMIAVLVGCAAPAPEAPAPTPGAQVAPPTPAAPTPAPPPKLAIYGITASRPTGSYYMLIAPACEYVNANSTLIRVTPAESGGSVENYRRVSRGSFGFGMSLNPTIGDGWQGTGVFEEPMQDVRIIGPGMKALAHLVMVRADSPVQVLEDLAGHSYGPGAPGSGAELLTIMFLTYAGILDEVDLKAFTYAEMLDMVADRTLVGHARLATPPSSYMDTCDVTLNGIRLLNIKKLIDETTILKDNPLYQRIEVPADTHTWQEEDISTLSMLDWVTANKDTPDEHVYELARLIYSEDNIKHLDATVPHLHQWWPKSPDPLAGLPLPLHPGAAKFWEDQGVTIPESTFK